MLTTSIIQEASSMSRRPPKDQAAKDEAVRQLEWLMSTAGLSQAEIARRLKTYPPTVFRWVKGRVDPSPMACLMIKQLYDDEQARLDL